MPIVFQNLVKKIARVHGFYASCEFRGCYLQRAGVNIAAFYWNDGRVLFDTGGLNDESIRSIVPMMRAHFSTNVYGHGLISFVQSTANTPTNA